MAGKFDEAISGLKTLALAKSRKADDHDNQADEHAAYLADHRRTATSYRNEAESLREACKVLELLAALP